MNKSSLTLGFLVGLVAACVLFALVKPNRSGTTTDVMRLKIAHSMPTTHPVHAGIERFAERVAELSHGTLQLTVYPNGQLGGETQMLEQLQTGTLDFSKVSGANIGDFVSISKLFSLPYLFRDSDHYWTVLNGEVGADFLTAIAVNDAGNESGFRGLAYYDAGSRNFYTQTAILSPSDLDGLKIRVQNDPVSIDTVKAIGGAATPISWGELYTALQQGVVDGAENNPPSFVSSRHFEVCKEFSFDEHSRVPDVLLISAQAWTRLSAQEQAWVQQAALESSQFQREVWAAAVESALETMEAEGVTLHFPDKAAFFTATESVRQKYATGVIQEYVQRIQSVK